MWNLECCLKEYNFCYCSKQERFWCSYICWWAGGGTVSEVEDVDILFFSASPDTVQCLNYTKGGHPSVSADKGIVKLMSRRRCLWLGDHTTLSNSRILLTMAIYVRAFALIGTWNHIALITSHRHCSAFLMISMCLPQVKLLLTVIPKSIIYVVLARGWLAIR